MTSTATYIQKPPSTRGKIPGPGAANRPLFIGIATLVTIVLSCIFTLSMPNLDILNAILLAVMGAIALNVLMGSAGMISMGNPAFLAVGAFATVWFQDAGVPGFVAVVAATLLSGAVGMIVGLPAVRLRGFQLVLSSIAAFFIVIFVVRKYQDAEAGASGFLTTPWFQSAGLVDSQRYWAFLLLGVVIALILAAHATTTRKFGRALRLLREHEIAAATLGYRVTRYKLIVFTLTSAVIGLQGGLTANLQGVVSSENYTLLAAIIYIQMVIIGGLDSILGSVLGATIVISMPQVTQAVMRSAGGDNTLLLQSSQYALIASGVLVIVMILISPSGGLVGLLESTKSKLLANPRLRRN
ncbi:branched-chain amino acid ABC transporter permease [Rhodococcus sp. 14C212]|uniref:branched-chain amino acid ABC transporter permease n=1 Tax=Rhodococcus sp. 14C212 TaxID=2711209 RepID=UPI0013EA729D|nr:branched-chain amino acid ABC transporter permease [Rhodococcus sp. 14C212]NGP08678.1 branched-chain amino acid ABC transporter permease [Rhodococcus sp. 14C212]